MKFLFALMAVVVCAVGASAGDEIRDINGVKLSVIEEGAGRPMILIHGRGYSKEYMSGLFDSFKGKYHVYSYDTRGHGRSTHPETFTLDDDADDLAGLVMAYGMEKPIVVGFSMGSYIALKAAEKYPELFGKLILIGTRGRGDRYGDEDITKMNANDAAILRALIGFDNMKDIDVVKIPALVITGGNDKINPVREGRKVAEAMNAKFEVIPGAGHVAFMKPGELLQVCSLIDDFINEED